MRHVLPYGTLELPDDWEDQSTYQFVSPPDSDLAAPLARLSAASRMSVLLARALVPDNQGIAQFLASQMQEFRKSLPSLRQCSMGEAQHPQAGVVKLIDLTFEVAPNMPVRQLQYYFPTTDANVFTALTISCNAAQYDRNIGRVRSIFEHCTGGR